MDSSDEYSSYDQDTLVMFQTGEEVYMGVLVFMVRSMLVIGRFECFCAGELLLKIHSNTNNYCDNYCKLFDCCASYTL